MKFTTQGLALAGLDLAPPLQIELRLDPDEVSEQHVVETLHISEVKRVLPGRRFSGMGSYRDEPVFAKVFYGQGARRYWQRELDGAERMADKVPTPKVVHRGGTADGEGFVVLYEAVQNAGSVAEDDLKALHQAVRLVANLHDAGIAQTDIHLGNFLCVDDQVLVVDAKP